MPKTMQEQARVFTLALLVAMALGQNAAEAATPKSVFFGRWETLEPHDKYSANGKLYRMIDVVPCGKDMCGISVDGGVCGVTLFRVPVPPNEAGFGGDGRWGRGTLGLVAQVMGGSPKDFLNISLGDKTANLGSRNSMPTYSADYHMTGKAVCVAGAPSV